MKMGPVSATIQFFARISLFRYMKLPKAACGRVNTVVPLCRNETSEMPESLSVPFTQAHQYQMQRGDVKHVYIRFSVLQ